MKKIPFNIPTQNENSIRYIAECLKANRLSGDGAFTKKCHEWFEKNTGTKKALLTTSCTHALEMAAILLDIGVGDEVIMPSYTFVSTANAFILRGAKIVFVDINPDTMNIDEEKIEQAISTKTKAIVPVHYAGVSCEMDSIMSIAKKYSIAVVEDAAQGIMSTYKGKALGSIGHFGAYSFHETKNITSGEGGVLLINDESYIQRAEVIREKGTNRSQFYRGIVDKYRWIDVGSSYLPSEINAALLFSQLEEGQQIIDHRRSLWSEYYTNLKGLVGVDLPVVPESCEHNAHMFFIKLKNERVRQDMIYHLASLEIQSVFHYIPLHHSKKCIDYYEFRGLDSFTTAESERLLRLPLHYQLTLADIEYICEQIKRFIK
jgi:dTDP-4-amino-4,6-dideoxygalactose transaminase